MKAPTVKPVTEIKRHATEIIAQLQADHVPVLITEHGRSAAVLLVHVLRSERLLRADRLF
ncbi:type II toxin-antitoxin system prevent-host-death family antitoxin [Sorangium sp. So ce426]|uniref:type II toxin-antitoxin system prevent-host-death family antitoxin n=1 Tax=unclassified Sorangium TaxID=2621164 RepID=UPI003F5AEFC5